MRNMLQGIGDGTRTMTLTALIKRSTFITAAVDVPLRAEEFAGVVLKPVEQVLPLYTWMPLLAKIMLPPMMEKMRKAWISSSKVGIPGFLGLPTGTVLPSATLASSAMTGKFIV